MLFMCPAAQKNKDGAKDIYDCSWYRQWEGSRTVHWPFAAMWRLLLLLAATRDKAKPALTFTTHHHRHATPPIRAFHYRFSVPHLGWPQLAAAADHVGHTIRNVRHWQSRVMWLQGGVYALVWGVHAGLAAHLERV